MEKYIHLTVASDSDVFTVGQFLRSQGHLTKKQSSRAKFYPAGIQKNCVRCRITEPVLAGDEIRVCLETSEMDFVQLVSEDFSSLDILYEDQDVLAVSKPAGILTHPSGIHYADTLSNQVAAYFQNKKDSVRVRPIGRLDKETSGIVLFAKNRVAAQRLLVQRKEHILQKEYLAVVDGYLPQDSPDSWHTISFPVKKVSDHPLRMQAVLNPDANCTADASLLLPALTHYCTIYSTVNWSLISLRLDTGRTHQIRVHMASIMHPLLGDELYGPKPQKMFEKLQGQTLHAKILGFQHPVTNQYIEVESPLPQYFVELLKNLGNS